MNILQLSDGELVFTTEHNGRVCEYRASSGHITLEAEEPVFFSDERVYGSQRLTLTAVLDEYTLLVKEEPAVTHTARLLAEDRTVEAIEDARTRAGAPKRAKFRLGNFKNLSEMSAPSIDNPEPIEVEFYWKE